MGEVKKFFIQIFFIVLVLILALLYQYNPGFADFFNRGFFGSTQTQKKMVDKMQIGEIKVNVEIADSDEERAKGLGGRPSIATDSGMLFIFPKEDNYKFWMKGLSFPLDFVWIREGRVVDLVTEVPQPAPGQADNTLPIIESSEKIDRLLEVNAGFVRANGIKIGDEVKMLQE